MTKSREKTREELTAEIEDGKKKIRQFENREFEREPGKDFWEYPKVCVNLQTDVR